MKKYFPALIFICISLGAWAIFAPPGQNPNQKPNMNRQQKNQRNQKNQRRPVDKAALQASQALEAACAYDAKTLCPGTKSGDGKWMPCLVKFKTSLTEDCRSKLVKMQDQNKQANKKLNDSKMQICQSDIKKFCPGTTPGDGKWGPCMHKQYSNLTAACKTIIKGPTAKR